MLDVPLHYLVGVFVAVLAVVAGVELLLRREKATRWREYLVLLGMAALGAVYGAANDAVTVSISPDYFAVGKELGYSESLLAEAMLLGAKAGFGAGAGLGGVCLYACSVGKRRPPLPLTKLAWPTLGVVVLSAACGTLLGLLFHWLAGAGRLPHVAALPAHRSQAFFTVWGVHLGQYAGGLIGTVAIVIYITRRRRLLATARFPAPP